MILLDLSRSSSKVSKYQDPLHLLQDYVAEVSTIKVLLPLRLVFAAYLHPILT